ncbi:MAG: hypothetical protein WA890_07650, partial [Micromonospora sp.]
VGSAVEVNQRIARVVVMADEVQEQITVAASPDAVYSAVSDVHRIAVWSPECFAVWVTLLVN